MHKVMCAAVVTALFATVPVASQAQGQAFVTASAGQSHYSVHANGGQYGDSADDRLVSRVDDKDAALGVTGGYRWMIDDVFSIGPEAGFVDLGKLREHGSYSSVTSPDISSFETVRGNLRTQAALLGINAKWMLGDAWSLGLRTGFIHTWTRARIKDDGGYYYYGLSRTYSDSYKESSHDNGFYGALNVGYDFTRNFGVTVGYEHYHSDYDLGAGNVSQKIGVWAASAEFRF